jgi:glucan 1,3-beta-glucosidase
MSQNFYPGLFGGGPAIPEGHRAFLENLEPNIQSQIDTLNVPFMVTEFNVVFNKAGGGEMMRRHYDRYEELGWAATAWSYKVLTSPGMSNTGGWWFVTQYGGQSTGRWWAVTNKNPRMEIDLHTSSKEDIEAYLKELGTMELRINKEFRNAMVKKESPAKILPKGQLPPLNKAPTTDLISTPAEPMSGEQPTRSDSFGKRSKATSSLKFWLRAWSLQKCMRRPVS